MNVLIVEDEKPAAARLRKLLEEYDTQVEVTGVTVSVRNTVKWLENHNSPDLILMDISLSDGLSLDVFDQVKVSSPVIFTTAYDEYFQQAFDHNGIDYLLKPIKKQQLWNALDKYIKLKDHFLSNVQGLLESLKSPGSGQEKILARKGNSYVPVTIADIAYAFSEFKLTFIMDKGGNRYTVDNSLQELSKKHFGNDFFRANRKYLVSRNAVHQFSPFGKGRLKLKLSPEVSEEIVVSQENATAFKTWLVSS